MKNIERDRAVSLRKEGWSYKCIAKELDVSKGSVSRWCFGIGLTKEHRDKLREKCRLASILSGKKHKDKWDKLKLELRNSYEPPFENAEFMLGIGLYWGEGSKYSESFTSISNSDPSIIRIFIRWIETFFKNDFQSFVVVIYHYDPNKDEHVKNYWAKELKVEARNFKTLIAISKASKRKRNTLEYGTVKVYLRGKGVWKVRQKIEKTIEILSARSSIGRIPGFHPGEIGSLPIRATEN